MYVKTSNQQVETFPYSIGLLRKDNPNTSFPKNPSDEMLAEWDVYPVTLAEMPPCTHEQVAQQNSEPTLQNGSWVLEWTIRNKTQKELDFEAAEIRSTRNIKLSNSDWTQLTDAPLTADQKTAWANYRQELRDITKQAGFPTNVTWPVEP